MGTDYKPTFGDGGLNPMSRTAFDAMDLRDQSRFCLSGGTVYDDVPLGDEAAKDATPITWNGKSITRGMWDRMTNEERSAFVNAK